MSQAKIQAAFEKALAVMPMGLPFTGDSTNRTAVENVAFTPVVNSPYQALTFAPGLPENPTLGDGYFREVGLFRVRLYYPKHVGTGAIRSQAERLRAYFKRATTLVESSIEVIVNRTPNISPVSIIDTNVTLTVDIPFYVNVYPV